MIINNVLYELSDALTLTLWFKVKIWALSHQTYGHYVSKMNHFFFPVLLMCLHDLREDSRFQRAIAEGKERHFGVKFVLMVMVSLQIKKFEYFSRSVYRFHIYILRNYHCDWVRIDVYYVNIAKQSCERSSDRCIPVHESKHLSQLFFLFLQYKVC